MTNKTPTEMRDEARARMLAAKPGSKKWRDAEEDLNFWQGRAAMTPPAAEVPMLAVYNVGVFHLYEMEGE